MKNTTYDRQAGTREYLPERLHIDAKDMRNQILLMRRMAILRRDREAARKGRLFLGGCLIAAFVIGPLAAYVIIQVLSH